MRMSKAVNLKFMRDTKILMVQITQALAILDDRLTKLERIEEAREEDTNAEVSK